jgi:outer membrane biosynthesis protein TonB
MVKLVVPLVLISAIASAESRLRLGEPRTTPSDETTTVAVKNVVARSQPDLLGCYTAALAKSPGLAGEMSVVLVIRADGKVTGAGASGFDAGVDACVKRVLKTLVFAKSSEKIEAVYSWTFIDLPDGAFASLTGTGDISSGFDDANIYGGLLGNEGGGGTGWGTIGTGRYGTIGHGSGTGHGGMRGRSAAVPTVSLGQPATSGKGTLDKAIIRRYIKRNIQKVQYCYEKELLSHATLAGKVTIAFTIEASGAVTPNAKVTGMPEVEACLVQVIQGIAFPKPKNDASIDVKYPLEFRPAGS